MDWHKWGVELAYDGAALIVVTVVAGISPGWARAMLVFAIIILILAVFNSPVLTLMNTK